MEGDDRMQNIRNITDKILWVGASDRRLHLFENMFPVPDGVAYNSYVILDEKTAIMDTADSSVTRQYLENLTAALGGRQPDYLVVNHMEPTALTLRSWHGSIPRCRSWATRRPSA
mgnify:CR=1 FL=1